MDNELAATACRIASQGAIEYLRVHGLTADMTALSECIRSWVKIKLPDALGDAREALACGMGHVAEQTFAASMMLAGIEAAKEASNPPVLA
jgi:hypothetical protein